MKDDSSVFCWRLLAPCAGLAQTGDTKNLLPKYGPSPKTEVEKEIDAVFIKALCLARANMRMPGGKVKLLETTSVENQLDPRVMAALRAKMPRPKN